MPMDLPSRRAFLTAAGSVAAAYAITDFAGLDLALAHAASAALQTPAPTFKVLSAAEAKDLEAIAMRIMPSDGTPGAKEAGVIHFMDRAFGSFQSAALAPTRKGLVDLNQKARKVRKGVTSVASLTAAEQDVLLKSIESGELFGGLRFMTMAGMFAHPVHGGNRSQVGWQLLDFKPRMFHQAPFGYYDAQAAKER